MTTSPEVVKKIREYAEQVGGDAVSIRGLLVQARAEGKFRDIPTRETIINYLKRLGIYDQRPRGQRGHSDEYLPDLKNFLEDRRLI